VSLRRGLFGGAGLILIAIAFLAAGQVADTREGLIAEIITLLCGLAGVGLLLYGLVPRRPSAFARATIVKRQPPGPRSANDLVIGGGGLLLAVILLGGLAASAGWGWAALGAVMLLPMLIGCGYLLIAFMRAPVREWTIDLRRLFRTRAES
jgi:peptidoglycan/LPS O-acetylase OafA/YrhL